MHACGVASHLDLGLFVGVAWVYFTHWLLLPLLHTSKFYWCDYLFEFTTIDVHRGAKVYIGKMCIMGSKWDIENFTESNDFGLWKVKMQAGLTQQKHVEALKGEAAMPATLTQAEKREMIDKTKSLLFYVSEISFSGMSRGKLPRHRCVLSWSHCTWRNCWLIGNSWNNNSTHSRWWSLNLSLSD